MTRVLPVPVAMLIARTHETATPTTSVLTELDQLRARTRGNLGEVHEGLDRLALGPKGAVTRPFTRGATPVLEKKAGRVGRVRPAGVAPGTDQLAKTLDEEKIVDTCWVAGSAESGLNKAT